LRRWVINHVLSPPNSPLDILLQPICYRSAYLWSLDVSDGLLSQIQFITNENLPWSPITASTDVSLCEDASLPDTETAGHQPSEEHTSLSPHQNFNNIPSTSVDSTLTTLPLTIDLADLIETPLDKLSLSSRRCKFRCRMSTCHKTFDRRARAEACYNKHFNQKPYICGGNCGSQMW